MQISAYFQLEKGPEDFPWTFGELLSSEIKLEEGQFVRSKEGKYYLVVRRAPAFREVIGLNFFPRSAAEELPKVKYYDPSFRIVSAAPRVRWDS
jgi:hypothetical protein